jgi:hypothetical protein
MIELDGLSGSKLCFLGKTWLFPEDVGDLLISGMISIIE